MPSGLSTNDHRGIPVATFLEDVEVYMKAEGKNAKTLIAECDQMYQKYKMMEQSLNSKKNKLFSQLAEIAQTLAILKHLEGKEDINMLTDFRLSDALFVKAKITRADKVSLWLGANVMLEYETSEALALLTKNEQSAQTGLAQLDEDMDFLRDQITTMEVNMARIYNFDVTERRKADKGNAPKA